MTKNSKEEIKTTIKQFFRAMDTQDYELLSNILAHDEEMVHIGTDEDEIWKGWNELHTASLEQFKNLEYYKAEIKDLQINLSATARVAWYSHLLNAQIKSHGDITEWQDARFTGVLEKREGQWKLVQTHVSLAA